VVIVLGAQAAWSIATTSASFDETRYLSMARDAYHDRTLEGLAEKGVAPLPVFLEYAIPTIAPTEFVTSITIARAATVLLVGMPLIALVYAWLAREAGAHAGLAAAALLALSPNIVANVAIATTDAAFILAALFALIALTAWLDAPSPRTFAMLAAGVAAATATKYSAVGLFAVIPIAYLAIRFRTAHRSATVWQCIPTAAVVTAALLAITFVVLWTMHGFGFATANVPGAGWRRLPAPLAGLAFQITHQRGGHFAYLLGQLSATGWWYYMPVALAIKSSPAELVVMALGFGALARGWRRWSTSALVWRVAFFVYGALAIVNRIDSGIRYVLVLVPLLVLIAFEYWFRWRAPRSRALGFGVAALVLGQAASSLMVGPHYLSYFNVFVGGPSNGYRYLVDSNIDWGQDLPALRAAFERLGATRPLLSYFGSAPLAAYGISGFEWTQGPLPADARFDWIAISTTYLNGAYIGHDPFVDFRSIAPSDRAGYSIFLYDMRRREVQEALASAVARTTGPA